jgi:hypothetical protein
MALKSMSPAVAERLDCLTEELGESVHMLGKAKRHGLNSTHTDYLGIPNKELLETELGAHQAADGERRSALGEYSARGAGEIEPRAASPAPPES